MLIYLIAEIYKRRKLPMRRLFDLDSPLMRALARFTDLMFLNILTVLCSLPIVTLGAAVTALYGATNRMQKEEGHLFSNYFQCFKENFKQATCLWLIMLPIGAAIIFAILYYSSGNFKYPLVPAVIAILGLLVWCMTLSWVFPLQAKFYNTVKGTLRNALICSVAFLWRTLLMTAMNLFPWILLLGQFPLFLAFGIGWVLVYFSGIAALNLKLLKKSFATLAPSEEWAGVEDEEE